MKAMKFTVLLGVLFMSGTLASCNQPATESLKPTYVELDDNVVLWKKVDGADGYEVKVGNNIEITKDLKYELNLFDVGQYDVSVRAFKGTDNKIYSEYSNTVTYVINERCTFSYDCDQGDTKLSSPVNVTVDDNIIAWDVVHFASAYRIIVDGKDFDETKANYYAFDSVRVGKYNVQVKAFSISEDWAISDASEGNEVNITKVYRPKTVKVSDYGAVGNGRVNDRVAIQAAIDAVYAHGGGTVIIDGNATYLTSNIFLRSNVTIKIEKTAMLKQITDKEEYVGLDANGNIVKKVPYLGTNINEEFQFNHCWFYNYPLICASIGSKNVSVIGEGTIKMMGYQNEQTAIRCIAVGFGNTKYFTMEGFTVDKYNSYAVAAFNSDHGIFDDIKIKGFEGGCNDGVSALNTSNVRVTECHIRSGDDSIDIGKCSDPRGDVWFTRWLDFLTPCTNIEIDNNDTDAGSDSCKGLAFFTWGGGNPDRSTAEVSDVYIHNNKFRTVGIWGSQSHDALYGGYGIVPAKHIRWYNNEIGLVQGGFYYDGISDMNCFQSMHNMMNGDFEYAGLGFWTTENDVILKTDDNNHYVELNGSSEIYEGLYLSSADDHILSAETSISGGSYKMFLRNLETGEIIKEETFNNTSKEKVSITVKVPNDDNYQVGFICSEDSTLTIDNVELKTPYSDETYLDVGLTTSVNIGQGENSSNIEGFNISSLEASRISDREILQVAYFLDINSITDLNDGYAMFIPLIQRYTGEEWINVADGNVTLKYSDFQVKDGKALMIFKLRLPSEYNKETDYISPRMFFHSSINCTVTRMIVGSNDLDFSYFSDYPVTGVAPITSGKLSVLDIDTEKVIYDAGSGVKYTAPAGGNSEWIQGLNVMPGTNDKAKAGDNFKFIYCFTVDGSVPDGSSLTFHPLLQRNDGGWSTVGESTMTVNASDLIIKNGKIIIEFVGKIPYGYNVSKDAIVPRMRLHNGLSLTLDRLMVVTEDFDETSLITHDVSYVGNITSGIYDVDQEPPENFYWSANSSVSKDVPASGQSGEISGLNMMPDASRGTTAGETVCVAYYLDIKSIGSTGYIKFSPLAQRSPTWSPAGTIPEMEVDYSEIDNPSGQVIVVFKIVLPDVYNCATDAISPRIYFYDQIKFDLKRIVISKSDFDFSKVKNYHLGCVVENDK